MVAKLKSAATFEEPAKTIRLIFDDPAYAGAEVVCNGQAEMGVYFELARLAESVTSEDSEKALRRFAEAVLVEWNVSKGGQLLPANADGLMRLSPKFATLIVTSWLKAVAAVPAPLASESSAGSTTGLTAIPMVTLASPGN